MKWVFLILLLLAFAPRAMVEASWGVGAAEGDSHAVRAQSARVLPAASFPEQRHDVAIAVPAGAAQNSRCNISGSWQHADKPASLWVDLKQQRITVQSHALAPAAVGLTVIRQLAPDLQNNSRWQGQMFDGERQGYVAVTIDAPDCHQLVVSAQQIMVLRLIRNETAI